MTKHETIATITSKLAEADDETVQAVAEFVAAVTTPFKLRPLSDRERALLEQAREEFRLGRTLTLEESKARTDALFAKHRAAKPAST